MSEKKWYTYLLCYSDSEEPFYVGKGQGNRMDQHEMMVNSSRESNTEKQAIIRQIRDEGKQVLKKKVAEFDDESEAYAHEIALIEMYRPQLTNIQRGGGPLQRENTFSTPYLLDTNELDFRWASWEAKNKDIHSFYETAHFSLSEIVVGELRREHEDMTRTWYEEKCQKLGVEPDKILLFSIEVTKRF